MLRIPGAHQAYFCDFKLSTQSKETTSGAFLACYERDFFRSIDSLNDSNGVREMGNAKPQFTGAKGQKWGYAHSQEFRKAL